MTMRAGSCRLVSCGLVSCGLVSCGPVSCGPVGTLASGGLVGTERDEIDVGTGRTALINPRVTTGLARVRKIGTAPTVETLLRTLICVEQFMNIRRTSSSTSRPSAEAVAAICLALTARNLLRGGEHSNERPEESEVTPALVCSNLRDGRFTESFAGMCRAVFSRNERSTGGSGVEGTRTSTWRLSGALSSCLGLRSAAFLTARDKVPRDLDFGDLGLLFFFPRDISVLFSIRGDGRDSSE